MAINEGNLNKIISAGKPTIDGRIGRQRYYDGIQAILSEDPFRKTGQPRQLTVTNWIRYISDQHTAFSVSNPINYISTIENNTALDNFNLLYKDKMLNINDNENFLQSFVTGLGVEVLSLVKGQVEISNFNPSEWIMLRNPDRVLEYAIHLGVYAPGTVIDGEIIEKEMLVYTVYNNLDKFVYMKKDNNIQLVSKELHRFNQIPVIDYQISNDWDAAISNSLIQLQDSWNLLDSGNVDDVLYNVDAMLVLKGYQENAPTEPSVDSEGKVQKSMLEELSETQTLSLEEDASAEFISKGNSPDKIEFALMTKKKEIHLEGQVVDFDEITGATGSTSGLALRLRFQSMQNVASSYTAYFKKGLRKRIELINVINAITKQPLIEDYKIVFTYNIPINDLEIIREANNLKELLDHESILSMLSIVDNPKDIIKKRELERGIREEKAVLDSNEE